MKLFTQTDLERCARLALGFYQPSDDDADEVAISRAVRQIVEETDPVFTKDQVLRAVEVALDSL